MAAMLKPYNSNSYVPTIPQIFNILVYHGDQRAAITGLTYKPGVKSNIHAGFSSARKMRALYCVLNTFTET